MKVLIILLVVLIGGLCLGQAPTIQVVSSPLTYKIRLSKLDKKKGVIEIEQTITNRGGQDVGIDRNALGYQGTFIREGKPLADGGVAPDESLTRTGDVTRDYKGSYIIFAPGQSYKQMRVLAIDDPYFEEKSIFKVWLSYGYFREGRIKGTNLWNGIINSNEICFVN